MTDARGTLVLAIKTKFHVTLLAHDEGVSVSRPETEMAEEARLRRAALGGTMDT